jgi:hypothetical protein
VLVLCSSLKAKKAAARVRLRAWFWRFERHPLTGPKVLDLVAR